MDKKNDPGSPISPEILRLTDKLAQDPRSRLFLPLGEEYIKAGMLDEAVAVLTDGLKVHANFHAARAMLGRAYLQKGQTTEAKAEFEKVIAASPDNLLAHRKLAALYKNERRIEQARASCLAVLSLNPKDAEMTAIMKEIERMEQPSRAAAAPVEPAPEVSPSPAPAAGDPPTEAAAEEVVPPALGLESHRSAPPAPAEAETAEGTPSAATVETPSASPASLGERMGAVESDIAPAPPAAPEVSAPADPAESVPDEINTESLADLYIQQGYYDKGVGIYRRLLAADPDNQRIFQKLERAVEMIRKPPAAPAPSATASEPPRAGDPAAGSGPDRNNEKSQKIQRLQVWLDKIKKGQG